MHTQLVQAVRLHTQQGVLGKPTVGGWRPRLVAAPLSVSMLPASLSTQQCEPAAGVRCMSSKGSKSWSDIASEALEVAKDAATKISETVSGATSGRLDESRREQRTPTQTDTRNTSSIFRSPGGVVGGLVGGLVGKMVEGVLKGAVKMVEEQSKAVSAVYDTAASAVETDAGVAAQLGNGVQCGMPFSQSSMSSSVNGQTRKTTTLAFMAQGPKGSGQVSVNANEQGGVTTYDIRVQLPNGQTVYVDERGGGGRRGTGTKGRQVYDATWEEIK